MKTSSFLLVFLNGLMIPSMVSSEIYYVDLPPVTYIREPVLSPITNEPITNSTEAIAEYRRQMQQTLGTGVSGDICAAALGRFTCNVGTNLTSTDGNTTRLDMNVDCLLESYIGMDFRRADDCNCRAHVSQINRTTRVCSCITCPLGFQSPIAIDCTNVEEDPHLIGTCVSLDCNGGCNGSLAMVNVPTPGPGAPDVQGGVQTADGAGAGGAGGTSAASSSRSHWKSMVALLAFASLSAGF